jgi:hypothetical protein
MLGLVRSGRAHGAQDSPVPSRKGCVPNAPDGGHSTQAGAPPEIAPGALPDPPALAAPAETDLALLTPVERVPIGPPGNPAPAPPGLAPIPEVPVVAAGVG